MFLFFGNSKILNMNKEFIIEKKKWFELLEAIQNDRKVFVL